MPGYLLKKETARRLQAVQKTMYTDIKVLLKQINNVYCKKRATEKNSPCFATARRMSEAREETCPARFINGCWRSSVAVGRSSTFTERHLYKKSQKTGFISSGSRNVGVPLVAISWSIRVGFSSRYGGSPSSISMVTIPKLQTSTFGPYPFHVTISGAI